MIRILLSGCLGRMGHALFDAAAREPGKFTVIAGTDINTPDGATTFPVYGNIADNTTAPDVVIDFSHHSSLPALAAYCTAHSVPLVVATTGHTDEEYSIMKQASESVPVFFSRNMSLGINLLIELCRRAESVLGEKFDVEIIEKHHNKKLDAPSGTALMLADAIRDTRGGDMDYIYDRHDERRVRETREIGIHSVRGGTIVGEHEVLFAGQNENITLSHSASSRAVFADGALRAAEFIVGKSAGMYSMSQLIGEMNI